MYDDSNVAPSSVGVIGSVSGSAQDGPSLERVTINLAPRAAAALRRAMGVTGDSKTDTINRALPLYDFVMQAQSEGQDIFTGGAGNELCKIVLM